MLMKKIICGYGLVSMSLLLGCSQGWQRVEEKIQATVSLNEGAQTYQDWQLSEDHPDRLFFDLKNELTQSKNKEQLPEALCQSLSNLSDDKLEIFEAQIFNEANLDVLAPCYKNLQVRLETYFESLAEDFQVRNPMRAPPVDGPHLSALPFKIIKKPFAMGPRFVDGGLPDKHIVLTFDDGPNKSTTPRILSALESYGVKAHFFVLGNMAKANQQVLKQLSQQGHSIGNHTMTHPCLGGPSSCNRLKQISEYEAKQEIVRAHQTVFDILGYVDPIFRFPYGASTPSLRTFLSQNSVADFFWSIDSNDWRAQSPQSVLERTMAQVKQKGKGIVLFHDIQTRTSIMMEEFLAQLRLGGFTVALLMPEEEALKTQHPFLKGAP